MRDRTAQGLKAPETGVAAATCLPNGKALIKAAVVLLVGLGVQVSAWAWNGHGHRLVARLAEAELTPKTQAAIQALLALKPGATLESVSTWADEHRNPTTASWHYVNFPRGDCHYVSERDCPDGKCIVSALTRQIEVLASDAPPEKRLLALKYVVHLAADIHQPLHAGFGDDRGGNSYQLQALGKGTNLHALWDTGLALLVHDSLDLERRLSARMHGEMANTMSAASMAQESCRIASSESFYPPRNVSASYIEQYVPVVEQQLRWAARRLAALLNAALGY